MQVDCLRKYTGRYPGKDMPVDSNNAPGKGGRWEIPESGIGNFTPKFLLSMIGGGGPVAGTLVCDVSENVLKRPVMITMAGFFISW